MAAECREAEWVTRGHRCRAKESEHKNRQVQHTVAQNCIMGIQTRSRGKDL